MDLVVSLHPETDKGYLFPCEKLTSDEKKAIVHAKASANLQELLAIKHMAERFVGVENESSAMLWLFYLPDFTTLFKDWYGLYIKKIFEIYTPHASACIHDSNDGYLLLRYEGERPRDVVLREITNNHWDYIATLFSNGAQAELACAHEIDTFENFLHGHTDVFDFETFVDRLSTFAGYGLDNIFPETFMIETFSGIDLSTLYHSSVSSWGMLFEGVLTYLEMIYLKEITEEKAIRMYVDTVSYLRWGDIESYENDLAFARKLFMQEKNCYPSFTHVVAHNQHLYEEKRIFGMPSVRYQTYLKKFSQSLDPSLRMPFSYMAEFATKAQRYNERRRILFTKSLRLMRELCERMLLDWRSISLIQLARSCRR